jgi:ABC-type glycerol-3-phosphate transport system substrate-binding protein
MPRLLLLACLVLAACGADGEPEAPSGTGITITGEARIGVVAVK